MKPFNLEKAIAGHPLQFRSGCQCFFVAYVPEAKPHCQLVIRTTNGQITYRFKDGHLLKRDDPWDDTGDILLMEKPKKIVKLILIPWGPEKVQAWNDNELNRTHCRDKKISILKEFEVEYED